MRFSGFLKPALFVYECVRIIILGFTLAFLLPGSNTLSWMAFTASGVLFPLMALFIWLDINRYRPYIPLFIAGKCIGIFALLGWLIVFRQVTMVNAVFGYSVVAELIFLSGDLLALIAILFIFMDMKKLTIKPVLTMNTEENNADNSGS